MSATKTTGHRFAHGAGWALCALLAVPWVSRAESLSDAWAMALQSDGTLAAAHSERQAAEADHSAALRQRWPALDLDGKYTQLEHAPNFTFPTPWDNCRRRSLRMTAMPWRARISRCLCGRRAGSAAPSAPPPPARAAPPRKRCEAPPISSWLSRSRISAVFRARKALEVAESNVASLKAHADDVQVMYDKEAVPRSDLLAAQVALANAGQQRLRAANALHLATAAYNRWVGQPLDRVPELEPPAAAPSADAVGTLQQLTAQALERRPELAAISAQQESLEQAARSERAQGLPQVALHAGYNHLRQ